MSTGAQDATAKRRRAVALCIGTTATVAVVELAVGWSFGLISVTAEGLHTAADLLDSLVAFVLVVIASRPADRSHPFGHGKYDSLAALVEGGCVGIAACWAIVKASMVLLGVVEEEPRPGMVAFVAMAAASVLYLVVSRRVLRIAKETGSPAVRAEALHLRTHVYITLGLIAGLAAIHFAQSKRWHHANQIDSIVAIMLGVFLLGVAYRIVAPAFRQLMDVAVPARDLERLRQCIDDLRHEFVEIHAIRSRSAGTERHVDFHLMVPPGMTVEAAHRLSHRIEQRVLACLPNTRLLIHIEPAGERGLRQYHERGELGILIVDQQHPSEREDAHHEIPGAHEA